MKYSLDRYITLGKHKFKLNVGIKTEIQGQSYGDYGFQLAIPTKNNNVTIITFNTQDIIGNPYSLTGTIQSKIFALDNIDISRDIELYVFTNGFIENMSISNDDISFENFALYAIDQVQAKEEVSSYELLLSATDGSLFLSEENKSIVPKLLINGKEVEINGLDCYWFEEDALISANSKGYLIEGGIGWKCINPKFNISTDSLGSQNIEYDLSQYFYTIIYKDDFQNCFSKRYKCVINYEDILVSKIIEIKNYKNPPFQVELKSSTGDTSFIKGSNVNLTLELLNWQQTIYAGTDFVYVWCRYDSEGNFIEKDFVNYLQQTDGLVEVSFSSNKIDILNTVRCFIYILRDKELKLIASDSINITIADGSKYFATISPNNILYKYDADGDSPLVADYDGPSPVSAIPPLELHIYKSNGIEFTENEYAATAITWYIDKDYLLKPTSEMSAASILEDEKTLVYKDIKKFYYTIANVFNKEKVNKTFFAEIKINEDVLIVEPNIQFIKEEESGLNGSKYTALILYGDKPYNPYSTNRGDNLIAIKKTSGTETTLSAFNNEQDGNASSEFIDLSAALQRLNIKVFKDSQIILNNNNNKYFVEWGIFDTNTNSFIQVTPQGTFSINSSGKACILQCKITIVEDTLTNTKEVIYCYYPIDIIHCDTSQDINKLLLPIMSGGYNTVTYTKDGINPKYDTTQPFRLSCFYADNDEIARFDVNSITWTIPSVFYQEEDNSSSIKKKFTPINRYDQPLTNLNIQAQISITTLNEDKVPAEPSEKEYIKNKIQYDNTKVVLEALLNYTYKNIYKNTWVTNINKCMNLLAYRESMLVELDKIESIIFNILAIRPNHKQANDFKTMITEKQDDIYEFKSQFYEFYKIDINKYHFKPAEEDTSVTKILGEDFNKEVKLYNFACDNLINYAKKESDEHDAGFKAYSLIKSVSIDSVNSDNIIEEQYILVANKIQKIINGLQYQRTAADLNSYCNLILPILNTYGILDSTDEYKLNDSLNHWFKTKLDELNKNYQEGVDLHNCAMRHAESRGLTVNIYKPIVFMYSRDGLSTVQGWDGNKLFVTDGNKNEYLTSISAAVGTHSQAQSIAYNLREGQPKAAPAGFNGIALGTHVIVDGKDSEGKVLETRQQGIYGYHNGQQTFMLNATNGIASFGVPGQGQIILDPTPKEESGEPTAIIKSGNYSTEPWIDEEGNKYKGKGLLIDLTTPSIKYGSEFFMVDEFGILTAQEAHIEGTIDAKQGNFGNLKIKPDKEDPSKTIIVMESLTEKDDDGNPVTRVLVDKDGKLAVSEVNISGNITAEQGQFGNLRITTDAQGNPTIVIIEYDANGNEVSSKNFIDADGNVTVNFAEEGYVLTAKNSLIGDWKVTEVSSGKQQLQSVNDTLILDPHNNSIHYNNVNSDTVSSATQSTGFYLGQEGLTIPNAIQIQPNATDSRWYLNSKELKLNSNTDTLIKIGASDVNLINRFLIKNDRIELISNIISLPSEEDVSLIAKKTLSLFGEKIILNSPVTIKTDSLSAETKNIILNDSEFQFKFKEQPILQGNINVNGLTACSIIANNLMLGSNEDISIASKEIKINKDSIVKIGECATLTSDNSQIAYNNNKTKIKISNNNTVEILASDKITIGTLVFTKTEGKEDMDIKISSKNVNIADNIINAETETKIINDKIEIGCITLLKTTAENETKVTINGTVALQDAVTVSGATNLNGPVTANEVTLNILKVGENVFTEADFTDLLQFIRGQLQRQ